MTKTAMEMTTINLVEPIVTMKIPLCTMVHQKPSTTELTKIVMGTPITMPMGTDLTRISIVEPIVMIPMP